MNIRILGIAGLTGLIGATLAACSGAPDPTVTPPAATATAVPTPGSVTPADVVPSTPLFVVLSPADGQVLESGVAVVRVAGDADLAISVNGEIATASIWGVHSLDLVLEDGPNLIEIVAASIDGGVASQELAVFVVDAPGVALDVMMPSDGFISSTRFVIVVGAASLDAVVAIDGARIELNELGVFEQTITLEPGPNLIEVTAASLSGQSVTRSLTVFVQES